MLDEASAAIWEELERSLRVSSNRVRLELQRMNPTTDPRYEQLFRQLVEIDGDRRSLRGERVDRRRPGP